MSGIFGNCENRLLCFFMQYVCFRKIWTYFLMEKNANIFLWIWRNRKKTKKLRPFRSNKIYWIGSSYLLSFSIWSSFRLIINTIILKRAQNHLIEKPCCFLHSIKYERARFTFSRNLLRRPYICQVKVILSIAQSSRF